MTDDSEHDPQAEQLDEIEPAAVDDAPAAVDTDAEAVQAEAGADDSDEAAPDADVAAEPDDAETESVDDAEGDTTEAESDVAAEPDVEPAAPVSPDEAIEADVAVDVATEAEPDEGEAEATLDEMVAELAEGEPGDDDAVVADDAIDDVATDEAAAATEDEPDGETEIPALLASDRISARWPFWAYLGVWVAFAGAMTYLLWAASSAPFLDHPLYAVLVFGGAGLVTAGPLLGLLVFFIVRGRSEGESRAGLLRTTLLRTAMWTVLGVVVWCLALAALELHRAHLVG